MEQPIKLDLLSGLRSHSFAADPDDGSEESKFDDVKALQEEPVTVRTAIRERIEHNVRNGGVVMNEGVG